MKVIWLFLSSLLYSAFVASTGTSTKLAPTSMSSKNIVFGSFLPGNSHSTWVLRFLDELASRGHKTTYVTVDGNLKYGAMYPQIKTVLTGFKEFDNDTLVTELSAHFDPLVILPQLADVLRPAWKPCYETLVDYLDNNDVDVLICDHISYACRDAGHAKKVPMIITATTAVYPDAATGYTNNNMIDMDDYSTVHQSIPLRFYNKFIAPIRTFLAMKTQLELLAQVKRESGLINARYTDTHDTNAKHAMKIVSSVFGLETARPVGPLVEFVGPILSSEYASLDASFESYLSTHQRVVYVAFGQHVKPLTSDVELLLTSLIQQLEKKNIDGIIWSNRKAIPETFPKSITSPYSGKTYDTAVFFESNPVRKVDDITSHIIVTQWSPQMAILLHPSVLVFMSHGGAYSIFESVYAGKRMLFFGFWGDQVGNGRLLSRAGVSEVLAHTMDEAEISERVERMILDKDGSYQRNIERFQALVRIHSKAAPARAADLVEEVAFTHVGNLIPHREDIGHQISFLKRNNLDIYGIFFLVIGSTVTLFLFGLFKLAGTCYKYQRRQQKLKNL